MGAGSIWHWVILLVVVVLLFGSGRISSVMTDVAKGIKSFKKGMADDDETADKSSPPKTIENQPSTVQKADTESTKAG
jgi:sec-independent protein translocase protein TatA